MKKCLLGDVADLSLGKMLDAVKNRGQPREYLSNIDVRWGSFDLDHLKQMRFEDCELEKFGLRLGDIVMCEGGEPGRCAIWKNERPGMMIQKALHRIRPHDSVCGEYLYYFFLNIGRSKGLAGLFKGATIKHLTKDVLENLEIELPEKKEQQRIVVILSALDRKIALNRKKIATLEKMAKEIYDYWFVQYDFPDANGRPYKSSGGEMVYSPELKRKIPKGWGVDTLRSRVKSVETGEWGSDKATDDAIEVHCLRGADMVDQSSLPRRFITRKKAGKLLSIGDLVVEISGGSPTQATGRICHVTEGLLKSYQGNLTCTNFCNSIRLEQPKEVASFYMLWKRLYAAGVMFGFEGKTSGLKNLQIDSFLSLKWDFAPLSLVENYNELYDNMVASCDDSKQIIARCEQIRDFLLPLLMNGQAQIGGVAE